MNTLPSHLFISESDGALYDTRRPDWPSHPLRPNYRRTHSRIRTLADLKATLRAGPYAWPGGHPMFLMTNNGNCLHFHCARESFKDQVFSFLHSRISWCRNAAISACDINWESTDLYCDHCNEPIESAYGVEESDE